jgi:hypothetical protein
MRGTWNDGRKVGTLVRNSDWQRYGTYYGAFHIDKREILL